jgi:hypothetical protein
LKAVTTYNATRVSEGMPDSWHIDEHGKSSMDVYTKRFGLGRKLRHEKAILDSMLHRINRLTRFVTALLHYRHIKAPFLTTGDSSASPEGIVLTNYDAGWHLRKEEELSECAKLDSAVLANYLKDMQSRNDKKYLDNKNLRGAGTVILNQMAESEGTTTDHVFEIMCKCALETWLRAKTELSSWENLSVERRGLLSDVLFSGFTMFGPEALEEIKEIQPTVLEFYRTFLKAPNNTHSIIPIAAKHAIPSKNKKQKESTDIAPLNNTSVPSDEILAVKPDTSFAEDGEHDCIQETKECAPTSLQELYDLIAKISTTAKNGVDSGIEPGIQIRSLLNEHLERLHELQSMLSEDAVCSLIDQYCDIVLRIVETLQFAEGDLCDLVPVLKSAWRVTSLSALEAGKSREWFFSQIAIRADLQQYEEGYFAELERIDSVKRNLEEIQKELETAKFTARTALRAKVAQKEIEICSARQDLDGIRMTVAERLVPKGQSIDDLMENIADVQTPPVISMERLNKQSVLALQSIVQSFSVSSPSVTLITGMNGGPSDEQITTSEIQNISPTIAEEASVITPNSLSPLVEPAQTTDSSDSDTLRDEVLTEVELEPESTEPPPEIEKVTEVGAQSLQTKISQFEWEKSSDAARDAFQVAKDEYQQVPAILIDAIAQHWIVKGHLNVAFHVTKEASISSLVGESVLDPALLRAAYFGMQFWPRDSEALTDTQRNLNLLNNAEIEQQLARRPSGKLVPFLLAGATFLPALFAGSETLAPTLLRVAAPYFDDHLRQLFSQTAEFSMRGGRIDLDTLRNESANETRSAAAKIKDDVDAWLHRNTNRTTGWAPTNSALRLALKRPLIERTIKALQLGEHGNVTDVRRFVDAYSEMASKRDLLDDLLAELRNDTQFADHADGSAYNTFCQQIQALESYAVKWLMEVAPTEILAKDVHDFVEKFQTLLKKSVTALVAHSDNGDLEHRAGAILLLNLLTTLQTAILQSSRETPSFGQTEATFQLPIALSMLVIGNAGPDLRLEWLAHNLATEHWLVAMEELAAKANAHWMRLLLLRQLEAAGHRNDEAISSALSAIAAERNAVRHTIDQYRSMSLQAQINNVIPEAEHHGNIGRSDDWLETLSIKMVYLDISDIANSATAALRGIERSLSMKAVDVAADLDRELFRIREKLGADAVPEAWESGARAALERRSLSLVTELINQLREHRDSNSRVEATTLLENDELNRFQQVYPALHGLLAAHTSPRETADLIIEKRPGDLAYDIDRADFRAVMEIFLDWRSKGKNKRPNLEKETYDGIVAALEFVGFEPKHKEGRKEVIQNCEYSAIGDVRRLRIRITRQMMPKGFPLLDGDIGSETSLNIIFVQGHWLLETFREMIEREGFPGKSVLIVGHPLNQDERGKLRKYCRKHARTVFLLDPVALAFIATFKHHKRLEAFLRISSAGTYFNPYTRGDARIYAPPEMRFGREKDTESLITPRGAALVYGGRQLGKTTLLHSAVQEFKKRDRENNHAFWLDLNTKYQHAVERNVDVKSTLFDDMAEKLEERGLIPKNSTLSAEERIRKEFLREGKTRVLFCLDEIDDVLNKDAASNFALIGSLKALVNDHHNRFRVVLAGLNNVNRFRTYPNVPLQQLGSPLPVGVLGSRDARALVLQPISALGYRFETPELVDRIMAFTNHHPSLLHIFCGELVEYLARENQTSDPYLIRQTDIESIESDKAVRKLSADRLDMTLNLDKRYTVVIYGLLDDDIQGAVRAFSVTKALSIARIWVPEEFATMTEASFETLLEELVGLGIFQQNENQHYVLRNQSILQLLGTRETITNQLQIGINGLKNRKEDVLSCHASRNEPQWFLSALSLRDEQSIINAKPVVGASNYSVSLVMGSDALGLTISAMKESFAVISNFDAQRNTVPFNTRLLDGILLTNLTRFSEAISTAISNWTANSPVIAIVPLLGDHPFASAMDMISIANESAAKAGQLKHPLRIVFLLGPHLMWEWFAHSSITSVPDGIGGQIVLDRWSRHACENLLAQQNLTATYEQGEKLRAATEGWYGSMMKFVSARKRKMSATTLEDLSTIFDPLTELSSTQFEKFVKGCGITELSWSVPLASSFVDSKFSRDDVEAFIELLLEEHPEYNISPDMASTVVRWWNALRLLDVSSRDEAHPEKIFYRFTPAVQRLLNEHLKRSA